MNSLFTWTENGGLSRTVRLAESSYLEKASETPIFVPTRKTVLLSDVQDIRTQQAAITKDVLFGLMGYEGSYTRFSDRYNRHSLHDRIHGPDFKIAKHLDVSLKTITKKLLRYGKHYSGLRLFAQIYDHPRFGRVNQSLCGEIARFLDEFEKLVLSFEEAFNYNNHFTLNQMENEISSKCADNLRHLYEIACLIHSDTEERNPAFRSALNSEEISASEAHVPNFNVFLKYIRDDLRETGSIDLSTDTNRYDVCKGGLVLQIVVRRINHYMGDSVSLSFLEQLFDSISRPYIALLNQWLSEGEIDDPFQEFFIKKNDLPTNIFYSNVEKYWDELFVIKIDGIMDQFESKELQTQVLATGKYLNIFKRCIGTSRLDSFLDSVAATVPRPIESLFSQDLTVKVKQFYDRANKLLLRLLFEGYQFRTLICYLHQTFLLKNSCVIDTFLEESFSDLSRNKHHASTIKPINTYNELFLRRKAFEIIDISLPQDSVVSNIIEVLQSCEKFTVDSTSFYEMAEEVINIKSIDVAEDMQSNENASTAVKRLVSKSLERRQISLASSGGSSVPEWIDNYTIAGVNIDFDFPFPLSLIVSENFVFEYQLLFKLQMMLKFTSKYTDQCWKDINFSTVWKHRGYIPSVQKLVLRCRVLNSRMKNLLNELQNYVNFTIVDTNFTQLEEALSKVENFIHKAQEDEPEQPVNRSLSLNKSFLRHISKNNGLFSDKFASSRLQASKQHENDVIDLTNSIGTYLNNMLRDSMVTNSNLLGCLRSVLNGVIQYNNIVNRLKKTLISMDEELLTAFKQDFPEKFGGVEFSDAQLKSRVAGLSEVLTSHWTGFNTNLLELVDALKSVGAENALMNVLVEKLLVI